MFWHANESSHFTQASGEVKSSESTRESVKSHIHISNSSKGLFIIAVLADNFFQFGTNYLS